MLSIRTYFGRFYDHKEKTEEVTKNATKLVAKASLLLSHFGEDRICTSGFRPSSYNKQIGGSPNSLHCRGLAIDLWDFDKKLGLWCKANENLLEELGLYLEDLSVTHAGDNPNKYWVHAQIVPPRSGKRWFIP